MKDFQQHVTAMNKGILELFVPSLLPYEHSNLTLRERQRTTECIAYRIRQHKERPASSVKK